MQIAKKNSFAAQNLEGACVPCAPRPRKSAAEEFYFL